MKKIVAAVALASAAISSIALAQETIRFGMEATYHPFEFFNEKNELTLDSQVSNARVFDIQANGT